MGGTQRLAERAGSGRAREFVMTGELFGAEEMERWGVVNRIYPEDEFERALARARRRAGRRPDQGARDDQARAAALPRGRHPRRRRGDPDRGSPALFATEDLQNAVKTFLEHGGPGHATFEGR